MSVSSEAEPQGDEGRLRIDPDARASYAEVKRRFGEQFASDRQAYTAGNAAFVALLLSAD